MVRSRSLHKLKFLYVVDNKGLNFKLASLSGSKFTEPLPCSNKAESFRRPNDKKVMQIKYLLIYSTLSGENGLLLSLTTRQSSTKYAIFPAYFAAFNFGINGSRFCWVERAMSSVMKRPLGFSLRALRRTCSFCFQSRNLHTMVRGLLESD